jgi:predicted nucleic acid-binding protein
MRQQKQCSPKISLGDFCRLTVDRQRFYALLVADRQRRGMPITTEDAQIAAIALTTNLTLVTRNTKDFVEIEGLKLVNPWESD